MLNVKIKKQRASKSWMVTIDGETEEYKIVGVSSAEEAMARVKTMGKVALSARPMRKFKNVDAPVDNVMEVQTQDATPATVARNTEEHDPSAIES